MANSWSKSLAKNAIIPFLQFATSTGKRKVTLSTHSKGCFDSCDRYYLLPSSLQEEARRQETIQRGQGGYREDEE